MSHPNGNGNGHALHPRMALWDAVLARGILVTLTLAQTKVLAAFIGHVNADAEAWPGAERLSDQAGLEVRSVRRTLAELTAKGLLVTVARGGGFKNKTVRRVIIPRTLTGETVFPQTVIPEAVTPPRSQNPDGGATNTLTPPSIASSRNNVRNRKRTGEHGAVGQSEIFPRKKTAGGRAVFGELEAAELVEGLLATVGVDDWRA